MTIRYRRFGPSISNARILRNVDISISKQNDIEETSILKVRASILTCPDIEYLSNEPSISIKDIEILIFDIDVQVRVFRYQCFFFGSCLGFCSSYSVLDTDCGVHIALRIHHRPWIMRRPGRPQPPQQGLHSAARSHRSHRAQHRLQPPERRSDQQSTSS
jgi:hypothetical protein